MKLGRQLFLLSLLTLLIPWAGYQHLQEMDQLLRDGQSRALLAQAQAVASVVSRDDLIPNYPNASGHDHSVGFFAPWQRGQTVLDGYGDDWPAWQQGASYRISSGDRQARWRLMLIKAEPETFANRKRQRPERDHIGLLVEVNQDRLSYYHPGLAGLANGDHLVLHSGEQQYALVSSAPGKIIARYQAGEKISVEHRIQGFWREHEHGYQVELQLPLELLHGRFNLAVIGADGEPLTLWPSTAKPPRLIYQRPALDQALQPFQQGGLQLSIIGTQGELLADQGKQSTTAPAYSNTILHPLKAWIYQRLLQNQQLDTLLAWQQQGHYDGAEWHAALNGQASAHWYQGEGQLKVRASAPILGPEQQMLGVVIAEQDNDTQASLMNSALLNLLLYSGLASLLMGAALLGYASWLGWRVRQLSRASELALDEYGRPKPEAELPPPSRAGDELGELSRNYHLLLRRLRAYSDYLASLSGKLSHELRTPLAVVRSSLDNLQQCDLTPAQQNYQQRAQQGSERLSAILNAMGAASQVEAAITSAEKEPFALDQLLSDLAMAYRDTFAAHCQVRLQLDSPQPAPYWGAPELLAQALDKLIENAVDFCPPGGCITLALQATGRHYLISVENDGPLLPDFASEQLFDSLVSIRHQRDAGRSHLGLGLHIVRLIAELHHATISAQNRADLSGVVFQLNLPQTKLAASK